MHKKAHCLNLNRLRRLSQPMMRRGLQALWERAPASGPNSLTVIYLKMLHLLQQFLRPGQNLCARSHGIIIIVNICTELWLSVIGNPRR